ncbi:MAG: fumarylacetoacetate hydrolase family protein [Oscillospiraceae bacterium]
MKLLQFLKGGEICLGIQTDKGIIDVAEAAEKLGVQAPKCMKGAIKAGKEGMQVLEKIEKGAVEFLADVKYAPVVTNPEKIMCVGLNYRKHAEETHHAIPENPVLFNKFASSLSANGEEVFLPRAYKEYDYEAELVIVIGKQAKGVSKEEAKDYIFGFTAGDDLSNRYLQMNRGGQWMIGKATDGFGPVGPVISTDVDGDNLDIKCYKNGELRQNSNTNDLIFNTSHIVSYISETITLKPGDLIFTGTPNGVIAGYPADKQDWLKPGDVIEVELEGIGKLKNIMI